MAPQQKETYPRKKRLLRDIDGLKWDKQATNESLVKGAESKGKSKGSRKKLKGSNNKKCKQPGSKG